MVCCVHAKEKEKREEKKKGHLTSLTPHLYRNSTGGLFPDPRSSDGPVAGVRARAGAFVDVVGLGVLPFGPPQLQLSGCPRKDGWMVRDV